ncbi:MAG TPA: metal-dependent hydrolase [Thermoplasmatales archaeon]|nr:metal-dependent hydrolase [Thermoplasmatales archaeon]
MQKKTHIAFGLLFFSIFYLMGLPFEYSILIGFMAFIPDIDWLMDKLWFKEDSLVKRVWYKLFRTRSMHRTSLHNVWAMLFFVILFGYLSNWNLLVIFATLIGYSSHLILDSLTVSGIYWLWPYGDERIFDKKRFYKNGKFVTGSLAEKSIFSLLIIVGGILLGLGLYKQNAIQGEDLVQIIITLLIMIIVGIVLIQKFVKTISKATSRIFRKY